MEPSAEPERLLLVAAAIGLASGLCALLATIAFPASAGMPPAAWGTLGLALLMAIWWSTEPVPIGVTALMPLIVLPLLGVADIAGAAAPYTDPLVFPFLGGN
jgi:sodium-dependent dicarboxylate transporter 2/3/5